MIELTYTVEGIMKQLAGHLFKSVSALYIFEMGKTRRESEGMVEVG
jgi:hypothetical protein